MSTLTFEDQPPFVDRGIKQGDAFRQIKPDKSGATFYFWESKVGKVAFSHNQTKPQGVFWIPVYDFDQFYEQLLPPNQLQDE